MIDIKNIKSITIVNPNSINMTSTYLGFASPIHVPDEIEAIKQEGQKRRNIYPSLLSMEIKLGRT